MCSTGIVMINSLVQVPAELQRELMYPHLSALYMYIVKGQDLYVFF